MDKQEMLAKIYEVIADKTLSFGCRIKKGQVGLVLEKDKYIYTIYKTEGYKCYVLENNYNNNTYIKGEYAEIIGHPIMIGDVLEWLMQSQLRYFEDNTTTYTLYKCFPGVINLWSKLRQPIDQQSDECIKYVYDLLPPQS